MIREERVTEERVIEVNPRSVDEGLWREVIKPPAAMDVASLAEAASKAAAAQKRCRKRPLWIRPPCDMPIRRALPTNNRQPHAGGGFACRRPTRQRPASNMPPRRPKRRIPLRCRPTKVEVQTLGKGQSLLPPIPSFGPKTPARTGGGVA